MKTVLEGVDLKLEGLFSSPWPRALETAEIVAREAGIEMIRVKPYLHECVPYMPARPSDTNATPHGIPVTTPQERDGIEEQMTRVVKRFLKRPSSGSVAVVCTHGNLIRYLVAEVFNQPWETWMKMEVSHAGITEIRIYRSGTLALASFNETGHLPPSMVTNV